MIYTVIFGTSNFFLLPYSIEKYEKNHPIVKYKDLYDKKVRYWDSLAKIIKNSEEDSFVFILTREDGRYTSFLDWVAQHKLEEYIMFSYEKGITNPNSTYQRRNLIPVVMASKVHLWRKQLKEQNAN